MHISVYDKYANDKKSANELRTNIAFFSDLPKAKLALLIAQNAAIMLCFAQKRKKWKKAHETSVFIDGDNGP